MLIKLKFWKKLVKLEQSKNEIKNKLEQLRATDNDIKINVALAKFFFNWSRYYGRLSGIKKNFRL